MCFRKTMYLKNRCLENKSNHISKFNKWPIIKDKKNCHYSYVLFSTPKFAPVHIGIIIQLVYNSDHINNPFSPLFSPHHSEYPSPFHLILQELIIKRFWIQCVWYIYHRLHTLIQDMTHWIQNLLIINFWQH